MKSLSELQLDFDRIPVNRYLRLRLVAHEPQRTVVHAALVPEYTQEHGVVHGALVSAAADTAAVWLFHPALEAGQSMASIEFKLNFVAPAFLDGGELVATATRIRRGKRIGVAQAQVEQQGRTIAVGLFTYMFFRQGES